MTPAEHGMEADRDGPDTPPFPLTGVEPVPPQGRRILAAVQDILEHKALGKAFDLCQHNVKVHTPYGMRHGTNAVVVAGLQLLAGFPDARLEERQGIADPDRPSDLADGFTVSAHNEGYSLFGSPTNRKVSVRTHTDYRIHDGRVVEAWTVSDGLAMTRQLGMADFEVARHVRNSTGTDVAPTSSGDLQRTRGQLGPVENSKPSSDSDETERVQWLWHEIWNGRRLDRIDEACADTYRFRCPSGRSGMGRPALQRFVLELLASFPDAMLHIENIVASKLGEPTVVSVRWRLQGTHLGFGRYGPPTMTPVDILGITHQQLDRGVFSAEWTVFDELALLARLAIPKTSHDADPEPPRSCEVPDSTVDSRVQRPTDPNEGA